MDNEEKILEDNEIWQAMVNGEVYDATHPELLRRLRLTREKLWEFNRMHPSDSEKKNQILHEILGSH